MAQITPAPELRLVSVWDCLWRTDKGVWKLNCYLPHLLYVPQVSIPTFDPGLSPSAGQGPPISTVQTKICNSGKGMSWGP